MTSFAPGFYKPNTPSPSYYVIKGVDPALRNTGSQPDPFLPHFLHVEYTPPSNDETYGSLGFTTLSQAVTHPLIEGWVETPTDFANKPMGVVNIKDPVLGLLLREGVSLVQFVKDHVGRDGDRPWGISPNIVTVDPSATRDYAIGTTAERIYRGVRHEAIAVAAVSAIIYNKIATNTSYN